MKRYFLLILILITAFFISAQEAAEPADTEPAEPVEADEEKLSVFFFSTTSFDVYSPSAPGGGATYGGMAGDTFNQVGINKGLTDKIEMNWQIGSFMIFSSGESGDTDNDDSTDESLQNSIAMDSNQLYFGPSFTFDINDNLSLLLGADILLNTFPDANLSAGLDLYYLLGFSSPDKKLTGSFYHWAEAAFDSANTSMYYYNWMIFDLYFAFGKYIKEDLDLGVFTWTELMSSTTRTYGTATTDSDANNTWWYNDFIAGFYYQPADVIKVDLGVTAINEFILDYSSTKTVELDNNKCGGKFRLHFMHDHFNVRLGLMPLWNQTTDSYQTDFDIEIDIFF